MSTVCSWCNKSINTKGATSEAKCPVTYGICSDCVKKVASSSAQDLHMYLNQLEFPVMAVDEDTRIIASNITACSLLGRSSEEMVGQLGGDMFRCVHPRLPGGCGKTVHCRSCTIRNTVTDTLVTGQGHLHVPALAEIHQSDVEQRVHFLISTELLGKRVLLRIDEVDHQSTGDGLVTSASHSDHEGELSDRLTD